MPPTSATVPEPALPLPAPDAPVEIPAEVNDASSGSSLLPLVVMIAALLLLVGSLAHWWHQRQEALAKHYEDLEAAEAERTRLAEEAAARLAERRAQIEEERRAALREVWKEVKISPEAQQRELAKREAAEQARYKARNHAKERKAQEDELRAAQQAAWRAQLATSHMVEDGKGGFLYTYEEDVAGGEVGLPLEGGGTGITSRGQQLARRLQAQQPKANGTTSGHAGSPQRMAALVPRSSEEATLLARIKKIEEAQAAAEAEAEAAYREELKQSALSRAAQAERASKLQARMAAQRLKQYREKQEAEEAANNAMLIDEERAEEMHKYRDIKAPTPTLTELRAAPVELHFEPAPSPQRRLGSPSRKGWLPSAGWKTKEAIKAQSEMERTGARASPRPRSVPIPKPESASDWLRSWLSNRSTSSPRVNNNTSKSASPPALTMSGGGAGAVSPPNKYRELVNKYSCS